MESLVLSNLEEGDTQPTKAARLYSELIDTIDDVNMPPHEFVKLMMSMLDSRIEEIGLNRDQARSIHGTFFEYLVGETLAQNGVCFMYYQAEVLHVPLTKFDWFLYHPQFPVSKSCKTKARDRWKTAAHEARALKQVYPEATNYLITIEPVPRPDEKKKLAPLSLDHFIVAVDPGYTKVVEDIASTKYTEAKQQSPIAKAKFLEISCKLKVKA